MIFTDIVDLEKSINNMMNLAIDAAQYDLIKVIQINHRDNSIHEMFVVNRLDDPLFNSTMSCDRVNNIVNQLILAKDTIVYNKTGADTDGKEEGKFGREVFVPFFSPDSETNGFIYLAKRVGQNETVTNNITYINAIKQLIHLVEESLYKRKAIENLYDTVLLLCEVINAKQPYRIANLFSVFHWAQKIAKQMDISELDIQKLQMATLIHDLGRIFIDDELLNKNGKYTDEELKIIQTIVMHSYNISQKLSQIYDLGDIPDIILYHQERMDGKGYPKGVTGDKIPPLSRILLVAKAVASMQINTPYRNAETIGEIINELKDHSGTQFDQSVADAAISQLTYKKEEIDEYFIGLGSYVTLSVRYQDGSEMNIWGNLRRNRDTYFFTPMEMMPSIQKSSILDCKIYLNANDRITVYKPILKSINKDSITISKILNNADEKSFFIKWFFEGKLVTKTKKTYRIFVNLIGGDFLDFYLFDKDLVEPIKNGIIVVHFQDDTEALLPGFIVFQQKLDDKVYYRFEYTNLPEGVRRKVFSAIFKKQLETRNLIKDSPLLKSYT